MMKTLASFLLAASLSWWFAGYAFAEQAVLSSGQTIYVPAYSHIYSGDREAQFALTTTLSIRNIDPDHAITITRVDYYESAGKRLRAYLTEPLQLGKLGSARYVVPERDVAGGSGANFIVEWNAARSVNAPIVESVMIGTQLNQGVSFTSRGRAVISTK